MNITVKRSLLVFQVRLLINEIRQLPPQQRLLLGLQPGHPVLLPSITQTHLPLYGPGTFCIQTVKQQLETLIPPLKSHVELELNLPPRPLVHWLARDYFPKIQRLETQIQYQTRILEAEEKSTAKINL